MSTYSRPSVVQEFIQSNSIERIGEWGGPTTPAKPWLEVIWMPFFLISRCYSSCLKIVRTWLLSNALRNLMAVILPLDMMKPPSMKIAIRASVPSMFAITCVLPRDAKRTCSCWKNLQGLKPYSISIFRILFLYITVRYMVSKLSILPNRRWGIANGKVGRTGPKACLHQWHGYVD